eukprot:TRINITY_DN3263_c0_g1_i4.p1 TRINITY_DN3263_c0_g1~~TRINITY_DN3263_c0_g1_i4.p1  ORF type:complete len:108 (-),score=2.95 TRINITY_DN3263_c0_g1_i4:215-538(-)
MMPAPSLSPISITSSSYQLLSLSLSRDLTNPILVKPPKNPKLDLTHRTVIIATSFSKNVIFVKYSNFDLKLSIICPLKIVNFEPKAVLFILFSTFYFLSQTTQKAFS